MGGAVVLISVLRHGRGRCTNICVSVFPSFGFFPFDLSSPSTNHLKFMHKVQDHKRNTLFNFGLCHFFRSGVMLLFVHILPFFISILPHFFPENCCLDQILLVNTKHQSYSGDIISFHVK